MALIEIKAGEENAVLRRVFFFIVGNDYTTPALGEAGGQPEISKNGDPFTATGIGTLTAVGSGYYYATLGEGVGTTGDVYLSRYNGAGTPEIPGDTVRIVCPDPDPCGDYSISCPAPAGDDTTLTGTIAAAAAGPASVTTDAGSVTQHNLNDLIAADKYLASKTAATGARRGLRFNKLVPPGSI